ncbi:MAG: DNA repair protein RecO, partial [Acidimicrobiia bacterium]|nr:DNA repair protein RecO [Acidimicrobiia bacterium]
AVLYEGRELDTITQVEVVDAFPRLREDLDAITLAGVMTELVDQVLFEDEPSPDLFHLLRRALAALERGHRGPDLLALFFLRVADHLGLAPALDACASCGTTDDLRFSIDSGGAICSGCGPASAERLPEGVLGHLVAVRDDAGRTEPSEWSEPGLRLMQRFLESHLERRLRSMAATRG